jgi:hypothetical protein
MKIDAIVTSSSEVFPPLPGILNKLVSRITRIINKLVSGILNK